MNIMFLNANTSALQFEALHLVEDLLHCNRSDCTSKNTIDCLEMDACTIVPLALAIRYLCLLYMILPMVPCT